MRVVGTWKTLLAGGIGETGNNLGVHFDFFFLGGSRYKDQRERRSHESGVQFNATNDDSLS